MFKKFLVLLFLILFSVLTCFADEVKILPYVYMEKVDWLKKVSRFLRAKLFHEKYEV